MYIVCGGINLECPMMSKVFAHVHCICDIQFQLTINRIHFLYIIDWSTIL